MSCFTPMFFIIVCFVFRPIYGYHEVGMKSEVRQLCVEVFFRPSFSIQGLTYLTAISRWLGFQFNVLNFLYN